MFEIYDDFLSKQEQTNCYDYFNNSSGWAFNGFSTKPDKKFWRFELKNDPFFSNVLFYRIQNLTNQKFKLLSVYANGQVHGQCGSVHKDSDEHDEYTFLYYLNPIWKAEWGGSTVFIKNEHEYQHSTFIVNRGILFKSTIPHVGLEPTSHFDGLRITVAFKLKIMENS